MKKVNKEAKKEQKKEKAEIVKKANNAITDTEKKAVPEIKVDEKTIANDLKNWNALTPKRKLEVAERDLKQAKEKFNEAKNIFLVARTRYLEALKLNGEMAPVKKIGERAGKKILKFNHQLYVAEKKLH